MAKPVKFTAKPKPAPAPRPSFPRGESVETYARADTSFDFGANVTKSGKRKRTRKAPAGGGS